MSVLNHLVLFTLIDLLSTASSANFQCTGSNCKCVDATGCETNCVNGFCQNKDFICTKNIDYCSFNCVDEESCQNSTFYIASNDFFMDCIGPNSCNNTEVYCGIPPQIPSDSDTNIDEFSTDMKTCAISASTSSMRNSYLSCNGNIANCYIDSAATTMGSIFDSQFDCSVDIGQCEFDCNYGCYRSLYTCQTPSANQCICNQCQQNDGVILRNISMPTLSISSTDILATSRVSTTDTATTTAIATTEGSHGNTIDIDTDKNTNNESIVRNDGPLFNFTDSKISNLEILYYIIVGAGGCLCCFICLCVGIFCYVVKSQNKTQTKNAANSGSATSSEIGSSDSMCNESVIDMNSSVNSSDTMSTKSTPIYINEDKTPKSEDDNSSDQQGTETDEKENISEHNPSIIDSDEEEEEYKPAINHHNIRYNNKEMNNMDRNMSNSSVHNLKIKLTKPANERPKKRKKKKKPIEKSPTSGSTTISITRSPSTTTTTSNSKSGHSHLSKNPLRIENNHLSPHLRHKNLHSGTQSPMSPLSAMSNPSTNQGTSNDSMDSMTSDSNHSNTSANSSEMNLKQQSAHDIHRIGFLKPKQFQEMMASYANATSSLSHSSQSNTATQFAAIQEQLLYIQQQNQLLRQQKPSISHSFHSSHNSNDNKIIKPSLHRHHTAKASNPKLTIIHSGNYDSNAMSEVDVQDIVNAKPRNKQTPTRTHSYTESASSDRSEDSCSCSDCHKQHRLTPIGTPASGAGSSNVSSSGSDDTCADTHCSCPHCRDKSCLSGLSADTTPESSVSSSRDSVSESDSESSSESSSSSSSSSSESDSDSSHTELENKYGKRARNKVGGDVGKEVQSPGNGSAMSMTPIGGYERGNNKTMIIHDDVETQGGHSRQYTLSTPGDHNRFGTLVIHNGGDANVNHLDYID